MRKRWLLVVAVALLAISAQPVSAASVNYRIASSSSELQNGTLSNARVDSQYNTVRPHEYDSKITHRYPFQNGVTDVIGSDDLSGSSSETTGIAGNGRALSSGETLAFGNEHAGGYVVSVWVKPSADGLIYYDEYIELRYASGSLTLSERNGTSSTSLGSLPAGDWTQLAIDVDPSDGSTERATAFRDGGFRGTITQLGFTGETPTLGADGFAGTIDELRVYEGGATPGEARRLGTAPEAPAGGIPGLEERWAFDAGVDTVAYGDEGGDGTIETGVSWTADDHGGQALSFVGTSNGVRIADTNVASGFDDTVAFSARIRWNGSNSQGFQNIVRKNDEYILRIDDQDDQVEAYINTGGGSGYDSVVSASYDLSTLQDGYSTITARFVGGDQFSLFVNGTEIASSSAASGSVQSTSNTLYIGRTAASGQRFNGAIDEVRFYESAGPVDAAYLHEHPGAELNASGRYITQSRAVDASTGFTEFANLDNAEATVTWEGFDGSSWIDIRTDTYVTNGNKSVSLPEGQYEEYRADISITPTHPDYRADLPATGVSFTGQSPTLSNPSPTGEITSFDGDLEIDVSDPDFGDSEGDSVTVTASNSEGQIGSTTVTQNGTASISYDAFAGANNITWSATDDYGDSASATQQFTTPAQITVFRESENSTKIRNATVTIRFYPVGGDEGQVVTRSTTNGSINLDGLPADQPFVAVANVSGYESRRIFFRGLYEQQRIYLLNTSVESAETIFNIRDYTGQFPPDNTVLEIRRSINGSWRTISGDYFGASAQYPATLELGARYRLRLYNPETGAARTLGTYQPIVAQTQTIEVSPESGIEELEGFAVATINPQTRRVPALNDTQLSASVSEVGNVTIDSWRVTVTQGSTTISNTSYGSNTREATLSTDLGRYAGEQVNVTVVATLSDGETVTADTATFRVYESPTNNLALLALVGEFVGLSAPGTADALTSFLAAVLTVFVMAGTSTQLPVSGETTALVGVLTLTGFSVIGWVGYGVVFVSGSAVVAFAALRRGL